MAHYFIDILEKSVIARLTDPEQADWLVQNLGLRYGVIETETALSEKEPVPTVGDEPVGTINSQPDYGVLNSSEIAYEPFVVADVFADYDLPVAEVNIDTSRYELATDGSGFVRDIPRITEPVE